MGLGADTIISFEDSGKSRQVYDIYAIVRKKLKFLLETQRGDILSNIRYGSDLIYFVHKPIDEKMKQLLTTAVRAAVAEWMSYVNIVAIDNIAQEEGFLGFNVKFQLDTSYIDSVNINLLAA